MIATTTAIVPVHDHPIAHNARGSTKRPMTSRRIAISMMIAISGAATTPLGVSPFGPELETVLTNPRRYYGVNFSIAHEQYLNVHDSPLSNDSFPPQAVIAPLG